MKSNIYIFDLYRHSIAIPTSSTDFALILDAFLDRPDNMNPLFVELGHRLEKAAPTYNPATKAGLWLQSPLDEAKALRKAAWSFELPEIEPERVERFLIKAATSIGLAAYDDRIGVGFLPGGQTIPQDRHHIWEASTANYSRKDTMFDGRSVRAFLDPALAIILDEYNFHLVPFHSEHGEIHSEYVREIGDVTQKIIVRFFRYTSFEISLNIKHKAVSEICNIVFGEKDFHGSTLRFDANFFSPGPDRLHEWKIGTPWHIRTILAAIRKKIIPLADLCQDLHGIDQIMNDRKLESIRTPYKTAYALVPSRPSGSDGSKDMLAYFRHQDFRLIVAHLNSNPSLYEIRQFFDKKYSTQTGWYRDNYDRLINHLDKIEPLFKWTDQSEYQAAHRPIPQSPLDRNIDPREGRVHNCELTFRLAARANTEKEKFWSTFSGPNGAEELRRIWLEHAESLPESDRISPDGIDCRVETFVQPDQSAPIEVLLLQFPPISGLDETLMLAQARRGEKYRACHLKNEGSLYGSQVRPFMTIISGGSGFSKEMIKRHDIHEFIKFICDNFESPRC